MRLVANLLLLIIKCIFQSQNTFAEIIRLHYDEKFFSKVRKLEKFDFMLLK